MILYIPHSSTNTLGRKIEEKDINYLTDWFTNDLFYHSYSDIIIFPYSRFVCDVERFPDNKEEMFKIGRGICYTKGVYGNDIEVQGKEYIIEDIYKPYHENINSLVRKSLTLIPKVLFVDCHSFTPEKSNSPDICIGANSDIPDFLVNKVKVL